MATTTSIVFKNSRMTLFYDHQQDYLGGTSRISRDGKEYNHGGWTIKVKNSSKNRIGKIICHTKFEYLGCILTHHKEYPLNDGTLNLEADFSEIHNVKDGLFNSYPEYEVLYHCNFQENSADRRSSAELLRQMLCSING